jgi:hypothetical protein
VAEGVTALIVGQGPVPTSLALRKVRIIQASWRLNVVAVFDRRPSRSAGGGAGTPAQIGPVAASCLTHTVRVLAR